MATSGICDSFKVELLQGGHCFNAAVTATCTAASAGTAVSAVLPTLTNISVGMGVTGTSIAANSVIAAIGSSNSFTISPATTGAITGGNITISGDVFKMALIKASPGRTFDHSQTNIGTPGSGSPTATNLGTDEIAASGSYSSGGATLVTVAPALSSTTAVATWGTISFTSATISTTGAVIYNSSTRQGASAAPLGGRAVEVLDFGGTQTVTSGTLSIVPPTADSTNGILRIA